MNKTITKKIAFALLIILIILGYLGYRYWSAYSRDIYTVTKGSITQKVSETGRIISAKDFDLAYGVGGEISNVYVEVGEEVKEGDALIELDKKELKIQLSQAQARQSTAQAKLDQLLAGASEEEIKVFQTALSNAEVAFADAKENLEDVMATAKENLDQAYEDVLNTLDDSYLRVYNASNKADLIQRTYFSSSDQESLKVQENKNKIKKNLNQTKKYLDITKNDPENENIDTALIEFKNALSNIYDALSAIREATEAVSYRNTVSSADKTSLDTHKTNINTALTNVVNDQQNISSIKLTNEVNINTAEAQLSIAEGILSTARDQLALKKASPREVDTAIYRSQIQDTKGSIELLRKQLQDTALRAPVAGIITKVNAEEGERIALNQIIVSLMSEARYELEVYIAEENITKIAIGLPIEFTLDAFSKDLRFKAQVKSIEPSATIIEDEVYYKVKGGLQEDITGILEGMTADVDIILAAKDNILFVSKEVLKTANGQNFVFVKTGLFKKEKRNIEVGLEGDGFAEIKNGLAEGEKIFAKPR